MPKTLMIGIAAFALTGVFQPRSASKAPSFRVAITYSAKAQQLLARKHETVIVAAMPYGWPAEGTRLTWIDEMGQLNLGITKREVAPGIDAAFDPLPLDKVKSKFLDLQGPQLLLNVYSGRKSSPNNLLDCSTYEGGLQAVVGTAVPIHCKLIGE